MRLTDIVSVFSREDLIPYWSRFRGKAKKTCEALLTLPRIIGQQQLESSRISLNGYLGGFIHDK
jgi:hypothetical protein